MTQTTLIRAYYMDGTIRVWTIDVLAVAFLVEGLYANTPTHRPIKLVIESVNSVQGVRP